MRCIDCGTSCNGTRCRRCFRSNKQAGDLRYDASEVVLTNGSWYNDNGVMRWRQDVVLLVMVSAFAVFLSGLFLMSGGWFGKPPKEAIVKEPTTPEDYTTHDDYDDPEWHPNEDPDAEDD